jgi:glycosyltransferase involved in cell wall biosynthesis
MDINIYILCYNESALLSHTINHYKKYLPSCVITIYDNESTDNSVEIAKSYGCNIVSWSSNNIHNEWIQINLRNECWKNIDKGWVIIADMDEFIYVTENELKEEKESGTSILQIQGMEMVGESKTIDLTDIDLQDIKKYNYNDGESKKLCFLREHITEMNYGAGSHWCNPIGNINYSKKIYSNRHMCNLGLLFLTNKMITRYERNEIMRSLRMNVHYTNDVEKVKESYNALLNNCKLLD